MPAQGFHIIGMGILRVLWVLLALVTYTILLNTGPRFANIYCVEEPAVSRLKTGLHGTRGAISEALQ